MRCKVVGGEREMYDKSQLMRGTLEGSILKILLDETTYGYEIVTRLQKYEFEDIKEGTIYPLFRISPVSVRTKP